MERSLNPRRLAYGRSCFDQPNSLSKDRARKPGLRATRQTGRRKTLQSRGVEWSSSRPALSAPVAVGLEFSATFLPSSRSAPCSAPSFRSCQRSSPRDASLVEWGGGRWPRACRPSTLWGLSNAACVDLAPSASKPEMSDFCASVGATALDFRVCKTAVVVPDAIVHSVDWPACFDSAPCRGALRFLPWTLSLFQSLG